MPRISNTDGGGGRDYGREGVTLRDLTSCERHVEREVTDIWRHVCFLSPFLSRITLDDGYSIIALLRRSPPIKPGKARSVKCM